DHDRGRAGALNQAGHFGTRRVNRLERGLSGGVVDTGDALVLAEVDGENGSGGGRDSGRRHLQAPCGWATLRVATSPYHPTACIVSFGGGGRGMFYETSRFVVTALLLFATSASGQAAPRLKDMGPPVPRDFKGQFGFYTVVLKIDSVQEKDGLIR